MDKILLLGLAGGGYYVYNNPDIIDEAKKAYEDLMRNARNQAGLPPSFPEPTAVPHIEPNEDDLCPDGYIINSEGTECLPKDGNPCGEGFVLSGDGLSCEATNPCGGEGLVLSADGTECINTGNPCGSADFIYNEVTKECDFAKDPCGDPCFKYNTATEDCDFIEGCVPPKDNSFWGLEGFGTGNKYADIGAGLATSLVAGAIFDKVGDKATKMAEKRLANVAEKKLQKELANKASQKASEALAKEASKKAEQEAVKKLAKEQARKAVQSSAQRTAVNQLAKRTSAIVAKETAKRTAIIAFKKLASKIATMTAKITALSSTGIGVLLTPLSVIALSLSVGLTVAGVRFEKDSPDDFEWDDLPDPLRIFLEAIPAVGDLISIAGIFSAVKTGCPAGTQEENLLCYEPPKDGWSCEAFLCTPNSSTYGFNPLSETKLHMTKRVELDTGTIPFTCPAGQEHGDGGLFCYNKPDWASNIVLGTAWEGCRYGTDTGIRCEDFYGGGVGTIPLRKGCGDFNITNCRDDGTSLWSDWRCNTWADPIHCDPMHWDGCCNRGLFGECYGCVRGGACHGGDVHTTCSGSASIVKPLWDLQYCGEGKEMVNSLCYDKCKPDYHREGLLCTRSYTKRSEVLTPHPNVCEASRSTNIADLCYENPIREGYERQAVGFVTQKVPADKEEWKSYPMFYGSVDFGTFTQKASYTRKPNPKFSIYGKRKVEPPPDPPEEPTPPLCSTLPKLADGVEGDRLCRLKDTPTGFNMSPDGLYFYKKCRDLYDFAFATGKCEKINSDGTTDEYDNKEGFEEVEYDYQ